ncbi:hypothetical protein UZ73_16905 [Alcaligenes faecalis]|nr:hypothetical protein UZ73_16905 [Alcaligenes faecalis]
MNKAAPFGRLFYVREIVFTSALCAALQLFWRKAWRVYAQQKESQAVQRDVFRSTKKAPEVRCYFTSGYY